MTGCFVVDDYYYAPSPVLSPTYETCFSDRDCYASDFCQPMIVSDEFFQYENAICSTDCRGTGPSTSCPVGITGEYGSCYVDSIVGGEFLLPACFERCNTDGDCLTGFVCANDLDLPGLVAGDAICVPGP